MSLHYPLNTCLYTTLQTLITWCYFHLNSNTSLTPTRYATCRTEVPCRASPHLGPLTRQGQTFHLPPTLTLPLAIISQLSIPNLSLYIIFPSPFPHLSSYMSTSISLRLPISLSVYLSIYLSAYPATFPHLPLLTPQYVSHIPSLPSLPIIFPIAVASLKFYKPRVVWLMVLWPLTDCLLLSLVTLQRFLRSHICKCFTSPNVATYSDKASLPLPVLIRKLAIR